MASEARPDAAHRAARPVRIERPRDVEGVVDAVRTAVRDGLTIRPVGAGSSPIGLTTTDGVVLDLTGLDRVRSVDQAGRRAVVEAGIRLSRLWPLLWEHGLAVTSPGGLDHQTLGGALATGEHGSGLRFGSLASRVEALELVLADGSLVRCSPQEEVALFDAARVGLGAFGVVTAVTLACDPARDLELSVVELPRRTFLDDVDDLVERYDHVEFGWRVDDETVLCTTAEASAEPAGAAPAPDRGAAGRPAAESAAGPARGTGDGAGGAGGNGGGMGRLVRGGAGPGRAGSGRVAGANRARGSRPAGPGGAAVGGTVPAGLAAARAARRGGLLPRMGQVLGLPNIKMLADRGYRVLGRRGRPSGREVEYAVPRSCFPAVFEELRERLDAHPVAGGAVRVRFGAAEEAWLAMGQGRETAYLSASAPAGPAFAPFFAMLELVAARYDGRPHWGRPHGLQLDALRARYPRFDDARAVRDRVDPMRVFANLHLDRVLGA